MIKKAKRELFDSSHFKPRNRCFGCNRSNNSWSDYKPEPYLSDREGILFFADDILLFYMCYLCMHSFQYLQISGH